MFFPLRVVGQLIESGPPAGGLMGATLEIQRTQQMEALEQQLMRQQARLAGGRGGGGAARRAPLGQGFAERLVDEGAPWMNQNRQPDIAAPPPEEAVRQLTDMGFDRDRALRALRRAGNDVQAATVMLLQDN